MGTSDDHARSRPRSVTVDQARAFCTVYDTRSFAEAARQLGYRSSDHSAVNRLVRRFEQALGDELVVARPDGTVSITRAGEEIAAFARAFVAAGVGLNPEQRLERAVVVISTYPAIVMRMARTAARLLEAREVELRSVDDRARRDGGADLVRQVADARIDIAVAPTDVPVVGAFPLHVEHAFAWSLRVALPEADALRHAAEVSLDELMARGFAIACSPGGHRSRQLLEDACRPLRGNDIPIAIESADQPMLRRLAERSERIAAVIPEDMTGEGEAFGPVLTDGERALGGAYSLFWREPRTPRDTLVEGRAQEVLEALA